MKLCAALVNLPRLTAPRLYPAGQTLGQTAKFRQTAPEIGVSPGFATHFRPACPKTVKDPVGRRSNAEAQTGKERPGSFGDRPGLHGNELRLRPGQGQAGDDPGDPWSRGTRRNVLRYRGSVRPVHRSEERRVRKECRSRWSPYH